VVTLHSDTAGQSGGQEHNMNVGWYNNTNADTKHWTKIHT